MDLNNKWVLERNIGIKIYKMGYLQVHKLCEFIISTEQYDYKLLQLGYYNYWSDIKNKIDEIKLLKAKYGLQNCRDTVEKIYKYIVKSMGKNFSYIFRDDSYLIIDDVMNKIMNNIAVDVKDYEKDIECIEIYDLNGLEKFKKNIQYWENFREDLYKRLKNFEKKYKYRFGHVFEGSVEKILGIKQVEKWFWLVVKFRYYCNIGKTTDEMKKYFDLYNEFRKCSFIESKKIKKYLINYVFASVCSDVFDDRRYVLSMIACFIKKYKFKYDSTYEYYLDRYFVYMFNKEENK